MAFAAAGGGTTFEALGQAAVASIAHDLPAVSKPGIAPSPVSVSRPPQPAAIDAARSPLPELLPPRTTVLHLGATVGTLCASLLAHAPLDPPGRDPLPKGVDESRTFPATLAEGHGFWSVGDDETSANIGSKSAGGKAEIARSMAKVFLSLFIASHACGVNLRSACLKKMALNGRKYPVEHCRGKSGKYTEYSEHTGITAERKSQLTVGDDGNDSAFGSSGSQTSATVQSLTARIRAFATDRQWTRYHTPRSIVLAMMGEVGELAELFQWRGDGEGGAPPKLVGWTAEDVEHVSQELADVAIYLMRLADVCGVDLGCEAMALAEEPSSEWLA